MIKTNFNTAAGLYLAELLAEHIVRMENLSNWDECVDDFCAILYNKGEKVIGGAVGALVEAEIFYRMKERRKNGRYLVKISNN